MRHDENSTVDPRYCEQLRKDDHLEVRKGFMLEMELNTKSGGSQSSTDSSGDEIMRSPEEDELRSLYR